MVMIKCINCGTENEFDGFDECCDCHHGLGSILDGEILKGDE